jgi:hypothetical protein
MFDITEFQLDLSMEGFSDSKEAVVAKFAITPFDSSSPSSKMLRIWREITDLSR